MGVLVFVGVFALVALWPRQHVTAPPVQQHSGGGGLLVVVVLGALMLLALAGAMPMDEMTGGGDVYIQERADQHVIVAHGTTARDVLSRPEGARREYHHSPARQSVMVSRCDANNCAVMYVDAAGMNFAAGAFDPSWLGGRLEITSHICSRAARDRVIARDGYAYLGSW
jgi:hypothetical protein